MAYKKTKSPSSLPSPSKSGAAMPIVAKEKRIMTRRGIIKSPGGPGSNSEIAEALNHLMSEGYTMPGQIQGDIIRNSEILLNDLGFIPVEAEEIDPHSSIVVEFSKDFSLLKTTNVDTTIKNSKILDPALDTLTPEPIVATEKFKSESDPFYELDDEKVAVKLTSSARKSRNKMLPKKPTRGAAK